MQIDEKFLDSRQIGQIQDEKIAQAVAYVYEHSSFYRDKFDAAKLKPQDITCAADLRLVPLTTKKEILDAGRGMWCVDSRDIRDIVTTSGMTGQPLLFPLTEADIDRLGVNEELSFRCAGLTDKDVVLLAVTMDRCFMAGLAYYMGLKKIGATAVRVGAGTPGLLLSMIDRLSPTVIVSVPSSLVRMASFAKEKQFDLAGCSVRKLVCIGEPVRDADMVLTRAANSLQSSWRSEVYSTYGTTELSSSMCECSFGQGGHLHPHLHHVEVLDGDDKPVKPGQFGRIVVTTLGIEAMPLLRYDCGDCSFMLDGPCQCGRKTPRIGPVLYRQHQLLKIKGTSVYPRAVQKALEGLIGTGLKDYIMVATSSSTLSDELEVLVELDTTKNESAANIGLIREHLRGELKVGLKVRAAGADEIEKLRDTPRYRKRRIFIDQRGITQR